MKFVIDFLENEEFKLQIYGKIFFLSSCKIHGGLFDNVAEQIKRLPRCNKDRKTTSRLKTIITVQAVVTRKSRIIIPLYLTKCG